MAAVETMQVIWIGKFNDLPVWINRSDFDPSKHRLPGAAVPPPVLAPVATGRPIRGGRSAAIALFCLAFAAVAQAQTATPTATITNTPTRTSTPTHTPNTDGAMARGFTCGAGGTCPTPPCDYTTNPNDLPLMKSVGGGHKTVDVSVTGGTNTTVKAYCHTKGGTGATNMLQASLSGVTCDTIANCVKEFDTWCDEVFLQVSACPTPSTIWGHLSNDK